MHKHLTRFVQVSGLVLSCLVVALQPHFVLADDFFNENDILFYDPNSAVATCDTTGTGIGIGGGAVVPKDFSLGTDPLQRRVNLIKALMADFGFTAAQAAGPVGNFMTESSGTVTEAQKLPPNVNQGSTTPAPPNGSDLGYGWAQWSGPRKTAFVNFLRDNGYLDAQGRATDAGDYAFLKHELTTGYKITVTELKKQTTPETAAVSFEATYESAGRPVLEERKAHARQAFNEYNGGGTPTPGTGTGGTGGCTTPGVEGGAAIVGNYAFPLAGTKSVVKNPGMFKNGTADRGGHPYTAYDILANPGVPVVAFLSGKVIRVSEDRCPGRLISIYNKESNLTISYLHLSFSGHVKLGDTVAVGQRVGTVGAAVNGCGIPHLHIDAAKGEGRPGCSRLNCPTSNASKFVDIGPQLFTTFQKLP